MATYLPPREDACPPVKVLEETTTFISWTSRQSLLPLLQAAGSKTFLHPNGHAQAVVFCESLQISPSRLPVKELSLYESKPCGHGTFRLPFPFHDVDFGDGAKRNSEPPPMASGPSGEVVWLFFMNVHEDISTVSVASKNSTCTAPPLFIAMFPTNEDTTI